MIPSKSNRSESRRSSILKSRKPRQPLQNVNLNSSSNENTPTTSKIKRRVSFAETKHVKEFCHSTEQGTVWDNTYEEHDPSLKGSFLIDQNAGTESKQNTSSCTSENDCTYIETILNYPNVSNVTDNRPSESDTGIYEDNNDVDCDLDLTNLVEYGELFNEESLSRQTILPNASVYVSKNALSSNIIVYRDADEKDCANDVDSNHCTQSYVDNVNSELDKTCVQDLPMEFTAAIPMSLPSSCFNMEGDMQKNVQNNDDAFHRNDFCTDCTTNSNDVSMEITQIVPISEKSANNLGIFKQVSVIVMQNCESAERSIVSNTSDNTVIFSTNSQMTKNIEQTQNANCGDDSMELTTAIQSVTTSIDTCNANDKGSDIISNTSIEITGPKLSKTYERNITHLYNENKENHSRQDRDISEGTDKIEFFNNLSMEMTRPVSMLPVNVHDKENLRMDEPISKDDRTMFFQDVSMRMKRTILKSRQEISDSITCKSLFKESTSEGEDTNKSVSSNERTKLLCKSMDFTEAVSVPWYHEKTFNTMHAVPSTEALLPRMTPREHSSAENPVKSVFLTDATDNKTIHNVSMEITAAVPSTLPLIQDATVNKTENLIASKNNTSQSPTMDITDSNCVIESGRSITKENFTIPREIVENVHNRLLDTCVNLTSTDNLDHSLSATLGNVTNRKRSSENENTDPRKSTDLSSSLVESQSCKENNAYSFPSTDDDYVNDVNDRRIRLGGLANNTMDSVNLSTQISKSNSRNSLNEECSFLRKSLPYLENSLMELQSIDPPSFVYTNSEEDSSFLDATCGDKLETFTITDAASDNNKNSSSNRLEPMNVEYEQMEDCHRSIITNKIKNNQETNCQPVIKTITKDNRINESNCYMTDTKDFNGENILSISNVNHEKTSTISNTNYLIESEIISEDQVAEECTRKRINTKLQNVEEKRCISNVEEGLKTEERQRLEYIGHLKETEIIIEHQMDREEYRGENMNSEVNPQNMIQKEEYADIKGRLESEQCVSTIEDEFLTEQDPFLLLSQRLETHAESDDCIWNVYHKNIDRKMIVFGFMSNSLLIVTFLSYDPNCSEENSIRQIKIISRLSDNADVLIKMVHGLIMEKINVKILMHLYRTHEDVLPMLDFVSQDVKLAMDFMFDLRRLDDLNLMQIARDEISFLSRSKQMDIILKITINVKRFDRLTPNDINVRCLLGTVKETEVKSLIKNVKKDHKFLRRYMNDVRDYIDIMEGTFK